MANLETAVLARQPLKVKREDLLRLARVVTDILSAAQGRRAARERAA
jgi:hypothetical protein